MSGPYVLTSTKTSRPRIKRVREMKQKLTWRQRLRKWFNKDLEELDSPEVVEQDIASSELSGEGMRFQLYRASGGYVVETRYYDHKLDRHFNKLYIVNDNKDLGNEIGKIITLESLR